MGRGREANHDFIAESFVLVTLLVHLLLEVIVGVLHLRGPERISRSQTRRRFPSVLGCRGKGEISLRGFRRRRDFSPSSVSTSGCSYFLWNPSLPSFFPHFPPPPPPFSPSSSPFPSCSSSLPSYSLPTPQSPLIHHTTSPPHPQITHLHVQAGPTLDPRNENSKAGFSGFLLVDNTLRQRHRGAVHAFRRAPHPLVRYSASLCWC